MEEKITRKLFVLIRLRRNYIGWMESHHVGETVFEESFVDGHEFGDKGLDVENDFVAETEAVFVVGGHRRHLRFQLAVAVFQNLHQQFLSIGTKTNKNKNELFKLDIQFRSKWVRIRFQMREI